MVRLDQILSRVPTIKFRKGGLHRAGGANAPAGAASVQQANQPSSAPAQMSTSSIPDIDLPVRYRRQPLSEEEIAHINGGGIKQKRWKVTKGVKENNDVTIIELPTIYVKSGKCVKDAIKLELVARKCTK